jgi:hypothetical protein
VGTLDCIRDDDVNEVKFIAFKNLRRSEFEMEGAVSYVKKTPFKIFHKCMRSMTLPYSE